MKLKLTGACALVLALFGAGVVSLSAAQPAASGGANSRPQAYAEMQAECATEIAAMNAASRQTFGNDMSSQGFDTAMQIMWYDRTSQAVGDKQIETYRESQRRADGTYPPHIVAQYNMNRCFQRVALRYAGGGGTPAQKQPAMAASPSAAQAPIAMTGLSPAGQKIWTKCAFLATPLIREEVASGEGTLENRIARWRTTIEKYAAADRRLIGIAQAAIEDDIASGAPTAKLAECMINTRLAQLNAPAPQPQQQAQSAPKLGAAATKQLRDQCFNGAATDEQRVSACTGVIQAGGAPAEVYGNRCSAYANMDLFDKAIADCSQALAIQPEKGAATFDYGLAYSIRAFAFARKNLFDQALADADRAIALGRRDSDTYAVRGVAYGALNKFDLAAADFRMALSLDPGNPAATHYLAMLTGANPQPNAGGGQSAADLNGLWRGNSSTNEVTIESRSDGLYVVAVTNNPGQSQPYVYKPTSAGEFRYTFPDGKQSVAIIQGPGVLRLTNPDGWTDVFRLIRRN